MSKQYPIYESKGQGGNYPGRRFAMVNHGLYREVGTRDFHHPIDFANGELFYTGMRSLKYIRPSQSRYR